MKYMIYQRVSTDSQQVATQQNECLNYIKSIESGKNFKYNIFSDPETSSSVKMHKRKGLQEFLSSLKEGHKVVVFKLDRLSRDVVEMVTIYRKIKEKKCSIFSLHDPDCDNEFIVGLMGVLAQKEKKDISDRTKASLRLKKQRGERSGTLPFGYGLCSETLIAIKTSQGDVEMKKGKLVEDLDEQKTLKSIC